jgi:competence protein ComEA
MLRHFALDVLQPARDGTGVDKRRLLLGGIVAAAVCAAALRAVHPGSGGETPALAAAPVETGILAGNAPGAKPVPARTATPAPVVVYVAGEVRRPGVYRLPPSGRVEDAVRAAGGQGPSADPLAVNLAERLRDGEEIVVPARGAEAAPAPSRAASTSSRRRRKRAAVARGGASHVRSAKRGKKAPPDAPVDVNAADATALESVPGIGPRLAARIVEFRETNGPFASPDELLDVNGVSERLLDEIAPYISFGSH